VGSFPRRAWVDVRHASHPDGNYQMASRVQVFDPPHANIRVPHPGRRYRVTAGIG
jgi:hypothetical protein